MHELEVVSGGTPGGLFGSISFLCEKKAQPLIEELGLHDLKTMEVTQPPWRFFLI
jgi:hypothetical protein